MGEMKDSGITWVGQIPQNWKVMPNKYVMYKKKDICPQYKGEDILSLTMDGVIVRDLEAGGKMPASFDGYQIIYPNNLLMCLFDYDVTPRCIGLIKNEGLTSPAYTQFVMKNGNNPKYYFYYYLMIDNTKELLHLAKNLRHSFTEDQLGAINAPVPPIDEQEKIANFLDEQCIEVDELAKDIQAQIETLEAYKKSIITKAVTKGLKPDVDMKDSKIEWIGKIPKDWTLTRLKYELDEPMKYGASESGVDYADDLPRYIRITDITSDNQLKDEGKLSLTEEQAKGYILSKETVLFARSGGTVGKTFLYKPEYGRAAFAGYLISGVANPNKMLSKWLYYFTLSNAYWDWANRIFTQATIQNIGADKYSSLPLVITSISEQQEIIEYLDSKCTEIDGAMAEKRKQLEVLEEYKKSIVYEYVTGKKEVPAQ